MGQVVSGRTRMQTQVYLFPEPKHFPLQGATQGSSGRKADMQEVTFCKGFPGFLLFYAFKFRNKFHLISSSHCQAQFQVLGLFLSLERATQRTLL